mgnify:CR=1 FL=1
MAKYSPFKMKGHTLPGINQKSEGSTDLPDGRSGSSPFQYKSPVKQTAKQKANLPAEIVNAIAKKESPAKMYGKKSPAKQTEENLSKMSGLGPRKDFGGVKHPELVTSKSKGKKVFVDGKTNKLNEDKIAKNKADFAKKSTAEKKAMQKAANAKRKAFEASPEYKKRKKNAGVKRGKDQYKDVKFAGDDGMDKN